MLASAVSSLPRSVVRALPSVGGVEFVKVVGDAPCRYVREDMVDNAKVGGEALLQCVGV